MKVKMLGAVILGLSFFGLPLTTEASFHERKASLAEVKTLVGSPVRSSEGGEVGKIKQLLINPEDGEIAYAVVARGGLFGLGEETVAIPWDAFEVGRDKDKKIVLTVDMTVFEIDELE